MTKTCQWGQCQAEVTLIVNYPAIVPGTAGVERSWDLGTDLLYVCETCAEVARAEVAAMWPRPEGLK